MSCAMSDNALRCQVRKISSLIEARRYESAYKHIQSVKRDGFEDDSISLAEAKCLISFGLQDQAEYLIETIKDKSLFEHCISLKLKILYGQNKRTEFISLTEYARKFEPYSSFIHLFVSI